MAKKYFTREGLEKMKSELEYLKSVRSKEIAERLKRAAAFGDLSENAEYDEAKEALAFLRGKILDLEKNIKDAEVIESKNENLKVQIGSIVFVEVEGKEEKYEIVSFDQANPGQGKISYESPLGKMLLGKSIGDKVEVKTPAGKIQYKISKIG